LFFINQIRMKIGVMFGSPETTTGGNALKFYSSMRLDIRRVGAIKVGEQSVGNRTRVKVVKNKLAPPFTECEFDVLYGEGISKSGDLIDLAVNDGILEKSGAWFSYGTERVGQGRENARTYLQERPKLLAEIEAKILDKHGLARSGKPAAEASASAAAAPAAAAPAATNGQKSDPKADNKAEAKAASPAPAAKPPAATNGNASDDEAKRAAAAAAARPRPRA
jgi:recombination protein RecA